MSNALFELDSKRNELKAAVSALGAIQAAAESGLTGEQDLAEALYFMFNGLYDIQADISLYVDELIKERKETNEQIDSVQ